MLDAAGPYRRLFAEPALRGLAVADACARLPQGMVSITLLMVTAAGASMTTAGLAVAGYALGQGLTGPFRGRLADRHGLARTAAACGGGYALTLLGLLAAARAGGPAWLLIVLAAAAGLTVPPLSPGMRSLWSRHATARLRHTAFAFDAAVFDLTAITGPVLASALATGITPAAALGLLVALTGTAVALIGARARDDPPPRGHPAPAERSHLRLLRSGAFRRLLLSGALANMALSGTEVALTAYVRQHHALWAAGPLLAGISAGSILGSLVLGARAPAAAGRRLPRLLACYALGLAALTAAALVPPLLAVAAPLAGLCLGPALSTLFSAVPSGGTEAQGWLNSVMNGGAAAGAAVAGLTTGRPVLALAAAAGAAAAAAAAAGAGAGRKSGPPEE